MNVRAYSSCGTIYHGRVFLLRVRDLFCSSFFFSLFFFSSFFRVVIFLFARRRRGRRGEEMRFFRTEVGGWVVHGVQVRYRKRVRISKVSVA